MRRREIWNGSKEFLSREYDACWKGCIDTYNRNESWFKFYIAFLTLTGAIIGLIFKNGSSQREVWRIFFVILVMLYIIGLGTLRILYNNRKIIVEYLNAINQIRNFFVERAKAVVPEFKKYVLLPTVPQKYFRRLSINLIMIYMLSFFNCLTLIGILLVLIEKTEWITGFGDCKWFCLAVVSFIINVFLLLWIVWSLRKKDKKLAFGILQ